MGDWQPIETAPRDRRILLYWPTYAYSPNEPTEPLIAIGFWKKNGRLARTYSDGTRTPWASDCDDEGFAEAYFSDNTEQDDIGLSLAVHAPSHWMPLPATPSGKNQ